MSRNWQGPSCSHGYSVYRGKHPDGKLCDDVLKQIVIEDKELLDKLKSCRNSPCLICNHAGCGWCPDCSPLVPEWD